MGGRKLILASGWWLSFKGLRFLGYRIKVSSQPKIKSPGLKQSMKVCVVDKLKIIDKSFISPKSKCVVLVLSEYVASRI